MGKRKLMTVINYLHECVDESGVKVSKIILFGSQIKKSGVEESDIDVVIVSKDFKDKDLFERLEMLRVAVIKTTKKYIVPLDVIAMTPDELRRKGSPLAGFARNGVVVYAA